MAVRDFIYLDSDGIQGALAQTSGGLELSGTVTRSVSGGGTLGGRGKMGRILKLMGLPSLDLESKVRAQGELERSIQFTVPAQRMVQQLVDRLAASKSDTLFDDLGEAARHVATTQETTWIGVVALFDAPQFRDQEFERGLASANRAAGLILESGRAVTSSSSSYDSRDDYYRRDQYPNVQMFVSFAKMTRVGPTLRATGHESILLRLSGGKRLKLGVFGILRSVSVYLQIKPYAVWI